MLKIEKIIHQVWGGAAMPYKLRIFAETWRRHNPDWTYKLWSQADMDDLVKRTFPELHDFYCTLPFDIQRWDLIRYLILYAEGGIYVDADIECFRPISPLLDGKELFFGLEPPEHICIVNGKRQRAVCNAFMGSVKGHPVWKFIVRKVQEAVNSHTYKYNVVLNTTGPQMISKHMDTFMSKYYAEMIASEAASPVCKRETKNYILGIDTDLFEKKLEGCYCAHYFLGAWSDSMNIYNIVRNKNGNR